ncbi:hypothetical protein T265_12409 [Opisthorchis viverrini]|uniref:Uncharacterized protein n=1 Tax=Opisthorchis viverrini TaxID=6198 RepID=A0A074YTD2_OPIVI|nr:hypothetical protein T265_12409 [Opisthorchis viverrini]KER17983.1 hypothetical protein T265_12409 [Opisthorchis viverrini]
MVNPGSHNTDIRLFGYRRPVSESEKGDNVVQGHPAAPEWKAVIGLATGFEADRCAARQNASG